MTTSTKSYESCADTAKRVRQALKANFPGITFSVRSHVYSGGASIRIRWTDGPRHAEVQRIAQRYEGASFDGMIDLKSYHSSVVVDETGPREVYFGSDFIFCQRDISDEEPAFISAKAMILAKCKIENGRFGMEWVDDLARGMVRDRDADGTLDAAFRRVVLRESA